MSELKRGLVLDRAPPDDFTTKRTKNTKKDRALKLVSGPFFVTFVSFAVGICGRYR